MTKKIVTCPGVIVRVSVLVFAVAGVFSCGVAQAAPTAIKEILKNRDAYDGKPVQIQGEAIGYVLKGAHPGTCWLNVKDTSGALGVVIDCALATAITHLGSYKARGDTVAVEGVFSKDCARHGREADLHAQKLTIVETGTLRLERVPEKKLRTAEMLGIISLFLGLVYFIRKEMSR